MRFDLNYVQHLLTMIPYSNILNIARSSSLAKVETSSIFYYSLFR
jgi:hypothetical protein